MLLVFFGTLDQVHFGIWQTQKLYFESFLSSGLIRNNGDSMNSCFGYACHCREAIYWEGSY